MKRRAQPRGYVLIFVLLVLLALSLIVAALYTQASDLRSANISNTHVQVAAMNASHGAMEALRAMRNKEIPLPAPGSLCPTWDDYRTCPVGTYAESTQADGGVIIDNGLLNPDGGFRAAGENGGLQYSYVIFSTPGALNRYTIRSTGYGGVAMNSVNLVTSIVEMEVEVGTMGFRCANEYDCTGS